METLAVELNSGICFLISGTTFCTFLTVPVRATRLNPVAGRAPRKWSSEEERVETALENLSPVGQEPGSGVPKVPAKPGPWGGK